MRPRFAPMLLVLLASACGDGDDTAPTDGGADVSDAGLDADATPDADVLPMPLEPAPPVLTPCPPGWGEVAASGVSPAFCDPYPEGLDDCPLTEMHLPGTGGCAAITSPCPSDGWPTDVPESSVVYVRAGASAGGDGTRDAPLPTLAEAVAIVPAGGAVAIAPGEYTYTFIDRDLALRGACAEVVISSPDRRSALDLENADVLVDNLRITGSSSALNALASSVELRRVVIDDIGGGAITVIGSMVTASRVRLHDVVGTALFVAPTAEIVASEIAFTGAMGSAVRSSGTTRIRDALVAAVGPDPEVYVGSSGDDTTFERLAVMGDGTMLAIQDSALGLRDSTVLGPPAPVAPSSSSILAFGGSRITVERTSLRRVWTFGFAAADPGSELIATDVVVRAEAPDAVHDAIEVGQGAHAVLTRVHLEGVRAIGVLATDEGTAVTADDLAIHDTQPEPTGVYGRALQVQSGASLLGRRVRVVGSHEVAIVAAAGAITLEDLVVEATMDRSCPGAGCVAAGIGIGAYLGGHVTVRSFLLGGNALAGAQLARDGELDLQQGVVSDNPVGINVQVPDYDVTRLTNQVSFRNNGVNLDSNELPLPAPTAGL